MTNTSEKPVASLLVRRDASAGSAREIAAMLDREGRGPHRIRFWSHWQAVDVWRAEDRDLVRERCPNLIDGWIER